MTYFELIGHNQVRRNPVTSSMIIDAFACGSVHVIESLGYCKGIVGSLRAEAVDFRAAAACLRDVEKRRNPVAFVEYARLQNSQCSGSAPLL